MRQSRNHSTARFRSPLAKNPMSVWHALITVVYMQRDLLGSSARSRSKYGLGLSSFSRRGVALFVAATSSSKGVKATRYHEEASQARGRKVFLSLVQLPTRSGNAAASSFLVQLNATSMGYFFAAFLGLLLFPDPAARGDPLNVL